MSSQRYSTARARKNTDSAKEVTTRTTTLTKRLNPAMIARVQKMLSGHEVKYLLHHGDQSISATGITVNLTDVTVGTGANNRIGDEISPTALEINLGMECVDTHNSVRMIIYRWRPDSGIDGPSITDIFNLSIYSATEAPFAIKEESFAHKSIFYIDEIFCQTLTSEDIRCFRKKITLPPSTIRFTGATNGMDQIYMSLVSDSAASSHPILHYAVRVDFKDG